MTTIETTTAKASLEVGDEIGAGGQAIVRRVRNHRQMLLKEYRGVRANPESLDRLIKWRDSLTAGDRELLDRTASWPRSRVVDGSSTVGVLIPEAPERFKINVRGTKKLNEVQYLAFGDRAAKLGLALPAAGERAAIVACLADLLELFDRHRIVHGDLSFKNVLWSVKGGPGAYLLDCDGARQGRHGSALPQVTTQHWTDPRVQTGLIATPDVDSDRLGLGLLFYRTYFQVRGNFTGTELRLSIPGSPPLNRTTDDLIAQTLRSSTPRAPAKEWQKVRNLGAFLDHIDYRSEVASTRNPTKSAPAYGTPRAGAPVSAPPTFDPTAKPASRSGPDSVIAPDFSVSAVEPQTRGQRIAASLNQPMRSNPVMKILIVMCVVLLVVVIGLSTTGGR